MKITHDKANLTKWTYSEVEAALCLWEAVLDFRTIGYAKGQKGEDPGETYRALEELFDGMGSFTMRAAVASIVTECEQAWVAKEALGVDHDTAAFDFDFCPRFIEQAFDNGLLDQALGWQHTSAERIKERKDWEYPLTA